MNKLLFIILIILLTSCDKEKCDCQELIIPDIYLVQNQGKSRFTCVNGITAKEISAKFLFTVQIRKFKIKNYIIDFTFYHDLIKEDISVPTSNDSIYVKTFNVAFGILSFSISKEDTSPLSLKELNECILILNRISICDFDNEPPMLTEGKILDHVPFDLEKLGIYKIVEYPNRNEFRIKVGTKNIEEDFMFLISNQNEIKKFTKSDDIISIYRVLNKQIALATIFNVGKSSEESLMNDWCGMGPKEITFECLFYEKKLDLENFDNN